MEKLGAIVFAGGKSSRMGQNKALIVYKGKRLVDRAVEVVAPMVDSMIVSSNEPLPDLDIPQVKDDVMDKGPIGGLYTCLKQAAHDWNLVIPCDAPYIDSGFYKKLIAAAKNCQAVVPVHSGGMVEPLMALYHKSILPIVEKQIAQNDYKLINLLREIEVNYIEFSELEQFKNMNYPSDLL